MIAGFAIVQLGGDAHPVTDFAHTTFEDVADAKVRGDFTNVR